MSLVSTHSIFSQNNKSNNRKAVYLFVSCYWKVSKYYSYSTSFTYSHWFPGSSYTVLQTKVYGFTFGNSALSFFFLSIKHRSIITCTTWTGIRCCLGPSVRPITCLAVVNTLSRAVHVVLNHWDIWHWPQLTLIFVDQHTAFIKLQEF